MGAEAPDFWWRDGIASRLLAPAGWVYGAVAARRMLSGSPVRIGAPVLCVGNFTLGGSGKTPAVAALAQAVRAAGLRPGILSRGHGGRGGPARLVDPSRDRASDVGDEPLLLAGEAPVAVDPARVDGARLLLEIGCDFILMDDGFQSRRLVFDHALCVVDAQRGVGNGRVFPAGPLRAPLPLQTRLADTVLIVGDGPATSPVLDAAMEAGKAVTGASIVPANREEFAGRRVLAFCGIGNPGKFLASLREAGATVENLKAFPDHHTFTEQDARRLLAETERTGATLVTTAKDAARLHGAVGDLGALAAVSAVLRIRLEFEDPALADHLVGETVRRFEGN